MHIPECSFDKTVDSAGGGKAGECTGTSGILSDYEINRVIKQYNPDVVYNEQAAVNWMTWNDNQWYVSKRIGAFKGHELNFFKGFIQSFNDSNTLKQKANCANSKCLRGLFVWTVDEGGPASSANPNDPDPKDTSMDGASMDGSDSGTGDFYIDGSVVSPDSNTAMAIAFANIIVAPSTLAAPTTFSIEPLVTPIEVAWATTKTVTISGQPTITTTVAHTVQITTFSMPTITASVISWWNWNITETDMTQSSTTLFPSISLDPITLRDSPNPQDIISGIFMTHTVTRPDVLPPPPWPWSTASLPVEVPTPTITFSEGGPPVPTCTANCGTRCTSFCDKPCLLDCNDQTSNRNWEDPEDPDPPPHLDNTCKDSLCVKKGCTGPDCDKSSHVCLGPNCKPTACVGCDCTDNGECDGDDCQVEDCIGNDCNSNGVCTGPNYISLGCIGPDCDSQTGE